MTEESAPLPVASAAGTDHMDPDHLRKEGWTMALYVAICLIAALTAWANVTAVPERGTCVADSRRRTLTRCVR